MDVEQAYNYYYKHKANENLQNYIQTSLNYLIKVNNTRHIKEI
jgi:hypothetical protein